MPDPLSYSLSVNWRMFLTLVRCINASCIARATRVGTSIAQGLESGLVMNGTDSSVPAEFTCAYMPNGGPKLRWELKQVIACPCMAMIIGEMSHLSNSVGGSPYPAANACTRTDRKVWFDCVVIQV
jgi:hypothetical protein